MDSGELAPRNPAPIVVGRLTGVASSEAGPGAVAAAEKRRVPTGLSPARKWLTEGLRRPESSRRPYGASRRATGCYRVEAKIVKRAIRSLFPVLFRPSFRRVICNKTSLRISLSQKFRRGPIHNSLWVATTYGFFW
jgi:hypothetical protein